MLGEKIREIRRRKRLNQSEFARRIGIRQGYLSEIESGKKMPGSKVILALKRSFPEINLDFIAGSGAMTTLQEEASRGDGYGGDVEYSMPAIGTAMTPEPIMDGDLLSIERGLVPLTGDFILVATPSGPSICRFEEGMEYLGVVVKLVRHREHLRLRPR